MSHIAIEHLILILLQYTTLLVTVACILMYDNYYGMINETKIGKKKYICVKKQPKIQEISHIF